MTDQLTPRETEILTLIAHGLDTKQIVARLGIAERAVRSATATLYPKIGANSHTQAMLYAVRSGLVRLEDVEL